MECWCRGGIENSWCIKNGEPKDAENISIIIKEVIASSGIKWVWSCRWSGHHWQEAQGPDVFEIAGILDL